MKKIILCLLLMTGVVDAQVYSINPSLDSLRANTLAMLNSTTSGLITTSRVDFIINMSIGEVCDAFPALEKVDTISASRASTGYALNSDFLRIKNVFKVDKFNDDGTQQIWTPVNYIPYDSLSILFNTRRKNADKQGDAEQLSTAYTWGNKLYFHPINYSEISDPETFIVFYYARDRLLTSGTDSTRIAPEYMEELAYHIMSWVRLLQEDYDGSNFFMQRLGITASPPKPREADLKR